MRVDGRVCLVTGAAGGIGQAASRLLVRRGAKVVAADLNGSHATEIVDDLGGPSHAIFIQADLTDPADIDRTVTAAVDAFDRIDVLINCAGIASLTKLPDVTPEEWDRVFDINLRSVFFLTQRVFALMVEQEKGTVICIASAAAKLGGVAVGPHYSASKAGIICLTKSLALSGAPHGITANCVCPGPTATPMTDEWGADLNAEFAAKIPLKRYATPEDVAQTICFLASDGAGYLTGEAIDVNGGLVMD